MGNKAGKDLSSIPIIIADVKDENSLQKMAERAKVINTYIRALSFLETKSIRAHHFTCTVIHILKYNMSKN